MPLVASNALMGALTFVRLSGSFGPSDVPIALDLARRGAAALEHQQLIDGDRAKNEFLAMLGHELRNPLGAMRASMFLLDEFGGEEPRVVGARRVMHRQIEQMTRLAEDLVDAGRVATGRLKLEREPIDVSTLLREIADDFSPAIAAGSRALATEIPSEPAIVLGNRTRLAQAIANLLQNAVKFTPRGGHIALSLELLHDRARITVSDDRAGIPSALLESVFQPFHQGQHERRSANRGLGLGLSLVRAVVAGHGGSVRLESDGVDQGTRAIVVLPLLGA